MRVYKLRISFRTNLDVLYFSNMKAAKETARNYIKEYVPYNYLHEGLNIYAYKEEEFKRSRRVMITAMAEDDIVSAEIEPIDIRTTMFKFI